MSLSSLKFDEEVSKESGCYMKVISIRFSVRNSIFHKVFFRIILIIILNLNLPLLVNTWFKNGKMGQKLWLDGTRKHIFPKLRPVHAIGTGLGLFLNQIHSSVFESSNFEALREPWKSLGIFHEFFIRIAVLFCCVFTMV